MDSQTARCSDAAQESLTRTPLHPTLAIRWLASVHGKTAEGLGLYVLSTFFLSAQAASAKLLGQSPSSDASNALLSAAFFSF